MSVAVMPAKIISSQALTKKAGPAATILKKSSTKLTSPLRSSGVHGHVGLARSADRHAPPAGPRGLAVEQRAVRADQEALRGGDEAVALPLQHPGNNAAGAAGEHGDVADTGVEGSGKSVPAAQALQPVTQPGAAGVRV